MHKTVANVMLRGGPGDWTTLNGRLNIRIEEILTECDCRVLDANGRCPRHYDDQYQMNVRIVKEWGVWDTETDDWWLGGGDHMFRTLTLACQSINANRETWRTR